MSQKKKLSTLQRRADYLARLIAEYPDRALTYERQELGALLWAINVLSNHVSRVVLASDDHDLSKPA